MSYDILIKLRSYLLLDATITSYVGTNISVIDQPVARVSKQITLRKSYGVSDSIITLCRPTVFITVWIKQKETTEPYKTCAILVQRIIDLLNRKGEVTLNESDLRVNQIVRTDSNISYDESQEYWTGSIIFDCVTND